MKECVSLTSQNVALKRSKPFNPSLENSAQLYPTAKFSHKLRSSPWQVNLDELMFVPGIKDALNKW